MKKIISFLVVFLFAIAALAESDIPQDVAEFTVRNGITFASTAEEILASEQASGVESVLTENDRILRVSCYQTNVAGIDNSFICYEFDKESRALHEIEYAIEDGQKITDPSRSLQQIEQMASSFSTVYGTPLYAGNGYLENEHTDYLDTFISSSVFNLYETYEWAIEYPEYYIVIDMFRMEYLKEQTYSLSVSIGKLDKADGTIIPGATPANATQSDEIITAEATRDAQSKAPVVMQKGDKGNQVKALQTRLIEIGYLSGGADGDFGSGTERAIIAFQTDNDLEPTGIVDRITYNQIYEGAENLILFRGINWYTPKVQVENKLVADGAKTYSSSSEDIYRMSATDYSSVTMGSDRADGCGYRAHYSNISVAGYDKCDTYACYVYPIGDDGKLIKDADQAEFYFGWYTFDTGDYTDIKGIYEDLTSKLTGLYGEGKTESNKYHTTVTWTDIQGNQIRILINDKENYCTVGYITADADTRLNAAKKAYELGQTEIEAEERAENASNTSGL